MEINIARMQVQDSASSSYANKFTVRNRSSSSEGEGAETTSVSSSYSLQENVESRQQNNITPLIDKTRDEQGVKQAPSQKMSKEEAEKLVKSMQEDVDIVKKRMSFRMDEKSGEVVVEIQDAKTGEVLDQLPPEELLKIRAAFKELIKGALLDAKA